MNLSPNFSDFLTFSANFLSIFAAMQCNNAAFTAAVSACILLLVIGSVVGAPAGDEIRSLPGWNDKLPTRMFSGHVPAGSDEQDGKHFDMHMWYMFVQQENVTDEESYKSPLLIWSNGGPGAASSYGLFTEFGPLVVAAESMQTNPPTLFRNPYSWSLLSNILLINGPAPVGYSYCDPVGPSGDGYACGTWNDTRTLEHNLAFLDSWFASFPEYLESPVYFIGESYAGLYIGMLVDAILNSPSAPPRLRKLNLKGMALGDACQGTEVLCGSTQIGPWLSLLFKAGQSNFLLAINFSFFSSCF